MRTSDLENFPSFAPPAIRPAKYPVRAMPPDARSSGLIGVANSALAFLILMVNRSRISF